MVKRNIPIRRRISDLFQSRWEWGLVLSLGLLAIWIRIQSPASPWQDVGRYGFYVILGLSVALLAVQLGREWQSLKNRSQAAEHSLQLTRTRMAAALRLSHHFAQAGDENEVIEYVLGMCLDVVGASGASFVPLDEHGHALPAVSLGHLPTRVLKDWAEHLATPQVRYACSACNHHHAEVGDTCPLLPAPISDAYRVYCLPLRRGELDFGMLNLYLGKEDRLLSDDRSFLNAMAEEMALALEAIRLRQRELNTLRHLKALQKADYRALIPIVLESLARSLEVDFSYLELHSDQYPPSEAVRWFGEISPEVLSSLKPVLAGIETCGGLVFTETSFNGSESVVGLRALIASPLPGEGEEDLGVLAVGSYLPRTFTQRHIAVVESVAAQVAMLIRYTQLVSDLEYQATMSERYRLAREIHDGLAQTLGYLKLMMAQMQSYLEKGEHSRLQQTVESCHATIAEAYQDARYAIDGLRVSPEDGLEAWIHHAAEEFQESAGMDVRLAAPELNKDLAPEVQAQLIRIVQEALTNVRKHARASIVWIDCREIEQGILLEIRDNGQGFEPEDVISSSQYGIRGMRERAELIGADFQIRSNPVRGTTVSVLVPTDGWERDR